MPVEWLYALSVSGWLAVAILVWLLRRAWDRESDYADQLGIPREDE